MRTPPKGDLSPHDPRLPATVVYPPIRVNLARGAAVDVVQSHPPTRSAEADDVVLEADADEDLETTDPRGTP